MRLRILFISVFSSLISYAQFVPHAYESNIDNDPEVYGGKTEWKRFLHDHMVYPAEDLKKKKQGTVHIFFIVTKDGKAVNQRIIKSVSPAIDKEALRLLNMLDWFPASRNGELLNVNNSVDITFSISKYKKCVKERGYDKGIFCNSKENLPKDSSLSIYESVDKNPTFCNPEKTFSEFIYSNFEYPELAKQQGLEGKITMSFIVEPDGRVSNIRIQDGGLSGGCNNEAIRVVALTTWKGAVKNNTYVRYRMFYTMVLSLKVNVKDNNPGSQSLWGR